MKRTLTKIALICSFSFFYINSAFSEIAFSFDKVNIISVMNVLSSEIKKNIAIEDDMDEQISLIINHPVNEQKIISTLQNALALKNIIMFEKENGDLIIKRNSNVKVDAPISKKD